MARGRKKGRLYPQIEKKVYNAVRKYPGASTHEVSTKTGISWSTADKYLRTLRRKKKIEGRKRGTKSVWY